MAAVVDPGGAGRRLLFQKVPESKTAKNRVHLDVNVGADAEGDQRRAVARAHIQKLVDAGGSFGATMLG